MNEVHWSDPYIQSLERKTEPDKHTSVWSKRPMFEVFDDITKSREQSMHLESVNRIRNNDIDQADIVVE